MGDIPNLTAYDTVTDDQGGEWALCPICNEPVLDGLCTWCGAEVETLSGIFRTEPNDA